MNTVSIEGYLVQAKLKQTLRQIVGDPNWRGRELRVPGTRKRWDMAFELKKQVTVVEFDGDEHYRNTLKIKTDQQKDEIANKNNINVVRMPYWVQLTTGTLKHYFGLEIQINQSFPHGFIATKVFPASFCEMGVKRFSQELENLPGNVQDAVIRSLRDRAREHGKAYVMPSSLCRLL